METGVSVGALALSITRSQCEVWRSRCRACQGSPSSNVIRLSVKDAESIALKNNPGNFCRPPECFGFGAGDAGSALESLAAILCQPDGGRCSAQQPHHRWGIEQFHRLHASRRWRYGQPTHHRLWAHHEPGRQRSSSGKGRRTERSRYEARCFVGRGPGFLQRAADTRRAAGSRADRSLAAVVIGPSFRSHKKQIKVRPGLELCQRESGAGEASLPGRAEQ